MGRENQLLDWLSKITNIPLIKNPGEYKINVFRNVPGRFSPIENDALPVRVVNVDEYALSQSTFTLVNANQEYNIQGIATLSSLIIKARGGDVKLSMYEGQSGLNYTLIVDGSSLEISAVPFGQISKPIAFFVQSTVASTVVEILGMRMY
jgi:hypothetical protein